MNYFELKLQLKVLYDRLEHQELTGRQIIQRIQKTIPFNECKIVGIPSISVDKLNFNVTGCYNPEDDLEGRVPIELEILYAKERNYYEFNDRDLSRDRWYNLVFDIITILGHEFVHLNQSRRRHFKPGKEYTSRHKNPYVKDSQEYLGIPDEVDAYAFTAAAQMAYLLPGKVEFHKTPVYEWYKGVFKKNDPVMIKLEKSAKRYYNKLQRQYNETNRR